MSSGQLNSPARLDNSTTEVITLTNGFAARVINTEYLLRGKFHAFTTRGQTNDNDYQDLNFLIPNYYTEVPTYVNNIDKEQRLAFFRKYFENNAQNTSAVAWMKQVLALQEEQYAQDAQTQGAQYQYVFTQKHKKRKLT